MFLFQVFVGNPFLSVQFLVLKIHVFLFLPKTSFVPKPMCLQQLFLTPKNGIKRRRQKPQLFLATLRHLHTKPHWSPRHTS